MERVNRLARRTSRRGKLAIAAVVVLATSVLSSVPASAQSSPYSDVPDDAWYLEPVIALAAFGVFDRTECGSGDFCPGAPIDRKTMAVWTVRVIDGMKYDHRTIPRKCAVVQRRFTDTCSIDVLRMANMGITQGCGDGSRFCPDRNVTRAEMAVFLTRAFQLETGPAPDFFDVPADAWYADAVAPLVASGIAQGCGDGDRFCPDRSVSRAEMAVFLWRADVLGDFGVPPESAARHTYSVLNPSMDGGGVISMPCALRSNQTLVCWGESGFGLRHFPPGRFLGVSAGGNAMCAVRTDFAIACWGTFGVGFPVPPSGRFSSVSSGFYHACGVRIDGTVACWGDVDGGLLSPPSGQFTSVSAGGNHACGVRIDGTVACWGDVDGGLLSPPSGQFTSVSVGVRYSCGIRTDGTVVCWGENRWGVLDAPSGKFTAVSAGQQFSCGLRAAGVITCWGRDNSGTLDAPSGRFVALSTADGRQACGIRTSLTVECWGDIPSPASIASPSSSLDSASAVWAWTPVDFDCDQHSQIEGKPGRLASAQIDLTGAIDGTGSLARPAVVRWTEPCDGGSVDHYLVQWRRSNEEFSSDRQWSVDAANTSDAVHSFKIRDPDAYAVRVIAVNSLGQSRSGELRISTPLNDLWDLAHDTVTGHQHDYPWLTDAWDYLNRRARPLMWAFGLQPGTSGMNLGRILVSGPNTYAFEVREIFMHELAHSYQSLTSVNGPDGELHRGAPAVAAAHLYLLTRFPGDGCSYYEMFADMPGLLMVRDGRWLRTSPTYWNRCSHRWAVFGGEAADVARSVFANQEVPQWFYDTYQRDDGTWNIEALRSDAAQHGSRILVPLREIIPEL